MNLNGYAGTAKSADIFALGPAAVAVSYMGFPGTMGSSDMVDYVLADGIVIPKEMRRFYAEKVRGGLLLLLMLLLRLESRGERGRRVGRRGVPAAAGAWDGREKGGGKVGRLVSMHVLCVCDGSLATLG